MAIVFSIAVSQILLALALAALLISPEKLRLPPIRLPLALFMAGTVISLALSPDPGAGFPAVRKFYVFAILLVVYSTFRGLAEVRWLVLAWSGAAAISAVVSFTQFLQKYQQARHLGRDFYQYYVPERITGFMSHWMTFGGEEMIVLLMLAAFLLFSDRARGGLFWSGLLCAGILVVSMTMGWTRSIWLASAVSGVYLTWFWRRRLLLAIPLVLAIGIVAAPSTFRQRATSIFRPHGADSNQFRFVTWETGWRIIRAHPWFGLGPEEVRLRFQEYVPPDAPKPLPTGWYGHLHNIYIQYAAERGIPPCWRCYGCWAAILRDFVRAARGSPSPERKFVLHGAIAVVLGILVSGCFEHNLGDSEILTMFLVTVACGYLAVTEQVGAGKTAYPTGAANAAHR